MQKKRKNIKKKLSESELEKKYSTLLVDDKNIEDMYLYFTVPGYNWDLKEGGSNILVTLDNIEEYVQLSFEFLLDKGIRRQMKAFRNGFNYVFDISHLEIFSPSELDFLLCGVQEDLADWSSQLLLDSLKFSRGYTSQTPVVKYFVDVLSEFDINQRRDFLRFLTGSPKLPVGGFKSLEPKFTLTKTDLPPYCADYYLPSVNTCFLFLKLPEYSSKEILKSKLLRAMTEGQNSFDLS